MNITIFYLFRSLFSQKWTFVNFLILVDCGNALGHIPVIAQYCWSEIEFQQYININCYFLFRRVLDNDILCMTGFGLNRVMVVMNRTIPVAIAIYRYAHVFYYDLMYDKRQKRRLQFILAAYTAGRSRLFRFYFSV